MAKDTVLVLNKLLWRWSDVKKLFTVTDIIIITMIVIISLCGYAICGFAMSGEEKTVVIEVDGKVFATYSMDKIKTSEIVDINGHNTVEICRDYVRMIDADCPNKLDVKQGKITHPGQIIICIPNKTTVRITGKSDTDAVSY